MNTIYAPEAVTFGRDTPRPPKPRVCFLAPTTWPMMAGSREIPVIGGAELQQSVIAPELARRGYDVSMISMDFGQEEGSYLKGVRLLKIAKPNLSRWMVIVIRACAGSKALLKGLGI